MTARKRPHVIWPQGMPPKSEVKADYAKRRTELKSVDDQQVKAAYILRAMASARFTYNNSQRTFANALEYRLAHCFHNSLYTQLVGQLVDVPVATVVRHDHSKAKDALGTLHAYTIVFGEKPPVICDVGSDKRNGKPVDTETGYWQAGMGNILAANPGLQQINGVLQSRTMEDETPTLYLQGEDTLLPFEANTGMVDTIFVRALGIHTLIAVTDRYASRHLGAVYTPDTSVVIPRI